MLFWKVQAQPFAEAKNARKSIPIFLTLLLAALLYYGFSEGTYFLYTKLYDFIQKQVALYKIDPESPIFYDLGVIIRSAAAAVLVLFASLYVRFLEGRKLSTMGLHKVGFWRNCFKGAVVGILLFGAMLGILVFSGSYLFEGELHNDVLTRIACILSVFICGFSFEYFFRGFVLSSLGARSRIFTAVLLTAVLSTAAQSYYWGYSYISVINNLLINIFFGLLAVRSGSVYTACAARISFLFVCQFVFGTAYSGAAYAHAFVPTTTDYQSLWAGTANGIDNGYTFTIVAVIALLVTLFFPKKAPEEEFESGPFFKHVPVENKIVLSDTTAASSSSSNAQTAAPALRRPESLSNQPEHTPQQDKAPVSDEDEEEWEEEEARRPADPNYKKPEDYLK